MTYIAQNGDSQPNGGERSRVRLTGCDFQEVAKRLLETIKLADAEAAAQGQEAHYDLQFLKLAVPFVETPCEDTALPLLDYAPDLQKYFDSWCPNGQMHSLKQLFPVNYANATPLSGAFKDSARPDADAPKGWWLVPLVGIGISLGLMRLSGAWGTACLTVMLWLLLVGWLRARRNRKPRSLSGTPF